MYKSLQKHDCSFLKKQTVPATSQKQWENHPSHPFHWFTLKAQVKPQCFYSAALDKTLHM